MSTLKEKVQFRYHLLSSTKVLPLIVLQGGLEPPPLCTENSSSKKQDINSLSYTGTDLTQPHHTFSPVSRAKASLTAVFVGDNDLIVHFDRLYGFHMPCLYVVYVCLIRVAYVLYGLDMF